MEDVTHSANTADAAHEAAEASDHAAAAFAVCAARAAELALYSEGERRYVEVYMNTYLFAYRHAVSIGRCTEKDADIYFKNIPNYLKAAQVAYKSAYHKAQAASHSAGDAHSLIISQAAFSALRAGSKKNL